MPMVSSDVKSLSDLSYLLNARGYEMGPILPSGAWTRFKIEHGDSKKSGSYRVIQTHYGMEIIVRNFKDKTMERFRVGEKSLNPSEVLAHEKELKAILERRVLKAKIRTNTAAIEAERRWTHAEEALSPMLLRRGLHGSFGSKSYLGNLLVPLRDNAGKVWGIETHSEKFKGFGRNESPTGKYHLIGEVSDGVTLFICEGFFTAATVHELSRSPVVTAFSANNLVEVAMAIRERFPDTKIIISGDDDETGRRNSFAAAKAINATVLIPDFTKLGVQGRSDFNDWNDFIRYDFIERGREMAIEQLKNRKAEKNPATFKQDWIEKYLDDNDVVFEYSGIIKIRNDFVTLDALESEIYLQADREGVNLLDRMIRAYLTSLRHAEKMRGWKEGTSKIVGYREDAIEDVKEFLRLLTGQVKPEEVSVLLHFFWQAKKKGAGEPAKHHMMPVFIGPTGSGKSEAVIKLLNVINPLWAGSALNACSDPRSYPFFEDYLVVNMDEMEKAEKTDLAGLKRMISSNHLTHRVLSKHAHQTVINRSTLIGSSNDPLDTLIKDPTSIRRFYCIQSLPLEDLKKNWEALNRMDYVNLWHSADISRDTPLIGSLKSVQEQQETMRFKTDVEIWIDDRGITSLEEGFITNKTLYEDYESHCNETGLKNRRTRDGMGRELARLGFKKSTYRNERGWKICIIRPAG